MRKLKNGKAAGKDEVTGKIVRIMCGKENTLLTSFAWKNVYLK